MSVKLLPGSEVSAIRYPRPVKVFIEQLKVINIAAPVYSAVVRNAVVRSAVVRVASSSLSLIHSEVQVSCCVVDTYVSSQFRNPGPMFSVGRAHSIPP